MARHLSLSLSLRTLPRPANKRTAKINANQHSNWERESKRTKTRRRRRKRSNTRNDVESSRSCTLLLLLFFFLRFSFATQNRMTMFYVTYAGHECSRYATMIIESRMERWFVAGLHAPLPVTPLHASEVWPHSTLKQAIKKEINSTQPFVRHQLTAQDTAPRSDTM